MINSVFFPLSPTHYVRNVPNLSKTKVFPALPPSCDPPNPALSLEPWLQAQGFTCVLAAWTLATFESVAGASSLGHLSCGLAHSTTLHFLHSWLGCSAWPAGPLLSLLFVLVENKQ